MATIRRFEDLDVWKLSRELVNRIYASTKNCAFSSDYGLRNQITKSAVSVMSNIAEGFESGSDQQFSRYLKIAKGSAGECRSQLYVAFDQNYISEDEFSELKQELETLSKKLNRLQKYLTGFNGNSVSDVNINYEG